MGAGRTIRTSEGERIAVVAGLRTPFARQASAYRGIPALDLGRWVVSELLIRTGIDLGEIDQLVFGQVVQMPEAPNIAREIVLATGMRERTDAYSVCRACATSFQAVASVAESMLAGQVGVAVAGGADSCSVLPIGVSKALARVLVDLNKAKSFRRRLALLASLRPRDLLPVAPAVAEYSTGLTMGDSAEQMAKSHRISRRAQDELALRSHRLAARAWDEGLLADQVMAVHVPPYLHYIDRDNTLRESAGPDAYAGLRPVFDRRHGSVTAGNASALTDGAAALLMMTEGRARALGFVPLGFLRSYAFCAIDVCADMLLGPAFATPEALDRAGVGLADLTLIEMHEAFAAQVLANLEMLASDAFARRELGRQRAVGEVDTERLNVLGGSLAYGHPFAASGARMILQLLHELRRRGGGLGLTTTCAAGGLGAAMVWEVDA